MSKFDELKKLIDEELELSAVVRERKNKSFKLIEQIRTEQEELQKKADAYDKHAETYTSIIESYEQLQEQNKPVEVPQFVVEWYEKNKEDMDYRIWEYIHDFDSHDSYDFLEWMNTSVNRPITTLIRMQDGYTVKQQFYYVDFMSGDIHKRLIRDPENGVFDIVEWSRNLIGVVDEMFTESEIKEKDERYLPFAEKVEEEQQ